MRRTVLICLSVAFISCTSGTLAAAPAPYHPQPTSGPFATPLTDATIDDSASAEWFDGTEHALASPANLHKLIWTQTTLPGTGFLPFGVSTRPGERHLRLGFKTPIPVGSILTSGGDQLSVLRPNAPYPGNLADDSQWIPATRIVANSPSTAGPDAPVVNATGYALWVLPPNTRTRAIRFSHNGVTTDSNYAGALGGIYILAARFANLAPEATILASANAAAIPLLTDGQYNDWHPWDNGPSFSHPVSDSSPEWITLIWPRPVPLSGLATLWAGFNAADVQIFTGPSTAHPQDAPDADWQSISKPYQLRNQYLRALGVDWMDFGKTVTTRAVRLRMTAVIDETHPHLVGKTHNGTRVWLGELMALSPLQSGNLAALAQPVAKDSGPNPPIPVHFNLDAPGYVTLVVDDAKGNRVRNLISDTWFEKGPNTVWWDGTDDLGRDDDAANHGIYLIPAHFVSPGSYQVRGLYHKAVDLHYEFSVYNAGHPAWETLDGKGGWLTNHTPPSSALFVPAEKAPGGKPLVYLGSYIAEGGAGLAWVDLDGIKQGGRGWIGGSWTAAPYLASDSGPRADPAAYAYVASVWSGDDKNHNSTSAAVRITALTAHADKVFPPYRFDVGDRVDKNDAGWVDWSTQIAGLGVHNNLAVVSLSLQNQLLFVDLSSGKTIGVAPIESPRGLAFDPAGRLLVLSSKSLLRYTLPAESTQIHPQQLSKPEAIIHDGFQDPAGITQDSTGNLYISDRGTANQVRVYSAEGKSLHAIGHPGPLQVGPYDPSHMNNPRGLTLDSNNHLWVAEEDFQPKRVSVWSLDGKLLHAFYGPSEYGGGGSLDPQDKTKFYYHSMEFKLDWAAGTDAVSSILYRAPKDLPLPVGGDPTTAFYHDGHRYFTNTYLGSPTQGTSIGMVYLDEGRTLRLVAALGKANNWSLFKGDAFKASLPPGTDLTNNSPDKAIQFAWSDLNSNGKVDPDEVTFLKSSIGSVSLMPDLTVAASYVAGKAIRYVPTKITPAGVPTYDLSQAIVIADGAQLPRSTGGGQILYSPDQTILTTAPLPFPQSAVGGVDSKGHRWSYPSLWPGLHPSHSSPAPDQPGELIGTTRLLGGFLNPAGSTVGPIWGINGNEGPLYVFTADGLFVTQLFQDVRIGKSWTMPVAQRNMLMNAVSPHDENFFPSLAQSPDGQIYALDGSHTSIVRVDGLGSLRRLPSSALEVSNQDIQKAQQYMLQREASRQETLGPKALNVTVTSSAPTLGTIFDSLKNANWATIDSRITQIYWGRSADVTDAAIEIGGDRLFAAFRTNDPKLLVNSGAVTNAPFKSGGALDLMIGTDPSADPNRQNPVAGDIRLLVYQVNGVTKATLYRAVVPGTRQPVPFSSPSHTITLDQVQDVSSQVQLTAAAGNYAFSIPLAVLGLKPSSRQRIKADIGILRGNGVQTLQRVYWSNKATGITSDVPSEAQLTPSLWGEWIFKPVP